MIRPAPDIVLRKGQHGGDIEVIARRLPGFGTDRREFPDTAIARAYASALARKLGLPIVDQLARVASADGAGGVQ